MWGRMPSCAPNGIRRCSGHIDRRGIRVVRAKSVTDREWMPHEISGAPGTKYDLVQLIDLDGDGDLDVLTCEEVENLGVIWYDNPAR